MRIVAVGECTRDLYTDRGVTAVGGISLNFAVQARRSLGGAGHVALVSCTGDDPTAAAVRQTLARAGVDGARVHRRPGRTACQQIHLQAGGERLFPAGGYDAGVLADFHLDPGDLACIAASDVVAVPYFQQIAHLFHPTVRAARPGALRVADLLDGADLAGAEVTLEALLDEIDVAFLSGPESAVEHWRPIARTTRTLVVVTHGAAGSSALVDGERLAVPAMPVPEAERVDTTGCGDAFQAAFTVAYATRDDVTAALQAGGVAAAAVIRHLGATAVEVQA